MNSNQMTSSYQNVSNSQRQIPPPPQNLNGQLTTKIVERPIQRVERPIQQIIERPVQRMEKSIQRVEMQNQQIDRPVQRMEQPVQRMEQPVQRVERSIQRVERPVQQESLVRCEFIYCRKAGKFNKGDMCDREADKGRSYCNDHYHNMKQRNKALGDTSENEEESSEETEFSEESSEDEPVIPKDNGQNLKRKSEVVRGISKVSGKRNKIPALIEKLDEISKVLIRQERRFDSIEAKLATIPQGELSEAEKERREQEEYFRSHPEAKIQFERYLKLMKN